VTLPPIQSVVLLHRRPVGPIRHGQNFFIDATAPVAIPSPAALVGGGSIGGTDRQGLQLRMCGDGAEAAAGCAGILLLPPFFCRYVARTRKRWRWGGERRRVGGLPALLTSSSCRPFWSLCRGGSRTTAVDAISVQGTSN